jgi:hypothetical protein
MNRLSLQQAAKELANIRASLGQTQHTLGAACEHRHDIESQVAAAQSQYGQREPEAYSSSSPQQAYQTLNQANQEISAATGKINAALNDLHSLGGRIESAMREQETIRRKHDRDAQNLGSGAAQSLRGGLADVQKVIKACQQMLGEINALTQSARHSLSLTPSLSPTQRGTIDTLVGDTAGMRSGKYMPVIDEILYLLNKNVQYLVAPPAVPHLGTSDAQRSGTIWDKVNYGGANLKYLAPYKHHVDISPDTRRMVNIGYNLQNTDGMYTVGSVHEHAEIDYGRHRHPY